MVTNTKTGSLKSVPEVRIYVFRGVSESEF